jgi:hypothetical protein
VEPSLIHKWHTKECSPDLDDARALACHKTMLVNMGQQVWHLALGIHMFFLFLSPSFLEAVRFFFRGSGCALPARQCWLLAQVTLAELVHRHNIDYLAEAKEILTNGLLPKKAAGSPAPEAAKPDAAKGEKKPKGDGKAATPVTADTAQPGNPAGAAQDAGVAKADQADAVSPDSA